MLIDTHCHLDAAAFDGDRAQVLARARAAGVQGFVIPAVSPANFEAVRALAHATPGAVYALGIHPLWAAQTRESDLTILAHTLAAWHDDPRLVAIGEIGLDFFVPELQSPVLRDHQQWLYAQQLDLAAHFRLPVLLHVRRAQDALLKQLRRRAPIGGIAHAFNGSLQQAGQFIDQGFALGMGGAMTYARARRIRGLARRVPAQALVLETDAPDIPPAWLPVDDRTHGGRPRNEPAQVAGILRVLCELRGTDVAAQRRQCWLNACRVLPRLGHFLAH